MKVGVRRSNLLDPMFPHQGRDMEIMDRIPSEARVRRDDFREDLGMAICFRQDPDSRTGQDRTEPASRLDEIEGIGKYLRMGGNAEELVDDPPGEIP